MISSSSSRHHSGTSPFTAEREILSEREMKFQIEDVTVYFPYDHIYPEQYSYMLDLKRALDAKGHCLLEMPTGTGKTIALLSLITSYALCKPSNPVKLLYCTRTVHEMEKTLAELRRLHDYQLKHLGPAARILAIGLSSRKNLCVNPSVVAAENRDSVDAACRKLTASWVRAMAAENSRVPTCEFYESFEKAGSDAVLPPGVYTLQVVRVFLWILLCLVVSLGFFLLRWFALLVQVFEERLNLLYSLRSKFGSLVQVLEERLNLLEPSVPNRWFLLENSAF